MPKDIGGEIGSVKNISFLEIVVIILNDELGYFKDDVVRNVVPFMIFEVELSKLWGTSMTGKKLKLTKSI